MAKTVRVMLVALMAVGLLSVAGAARASDDREAISRGDCSRISDWKVRIRTDGPSRLDLEFEAGEVPGQLWRVQMTYNSRVVFSGNVRSGADGEFDVDREVANAPGLDTLRGNATNLQTGETCRGSVSASF